MRSVIRGGSLAAVLLMAACNRRPDPRTAMAALREAFNRDACQSIYDGASGGFRNRLSRHDWESTCERLRASWDSCALSGLHLYRPARVPGIAFDVEVGPPFPVLGQEVHRLPNTHMVPRFIDPPPRNPSGRRGA